MNPHPLAPLISQVEPAMTAWGESLDGPPLLVDGMRYAMGSGGKRIRPCMVLAACEACGGDVSRALPEAVALELVHAYSLVHDDLPALDNDVLRRGKPTVHVQFGEDMAILVGDALLTTAFEVLSAGVMPGDMANRRIRSLAALATAAGSVGMVGGQVLDMRMEDPTADSVRRMHAGKTGALFVAAVRMGACAAGAPPAVEERLRQYGEAFGRAFQVGDDLEDWVTLGQAGGAHEEKVNWAALFGTAAALEVVEESAAAAQRWLVGLNGDTHWLNELAQWTVDRARRVMASPPTGV